MNKTQINFVIGLIILFICFKIFVGSGMFLGAYQPQVDAGKLGGAEAVALSGIWETIVAVVSAVGGIGVVVFFKVADFIQRKLFPNQIAPTTATDVQPVGNDQLQSDLARLLLWAVSEGDADMTRMLAEKLNGSPYLTANKTFPTPK